jgi:hypothetical protein
VPLWLRDRLVAALDDEPNGVELAALLGGVWAPPELVNMEGEPMAACEARYRIGDRGALAILDTVLDPVDEGHWSEPVEVDGRAWIRGTVVAEGADLVVSANSEARFARLRSTVEAAVPGLELVTESVRSRAEVLAAAGDRPPTPPEPIPAEAADALAAFVREQEQRWIDESVPALGGLTPRQAAADPTWREELRALLHEFDRHPPPPPGAATFDTGRLRAALGLDE